MISFSVYELVLRVFVKLETGFQPSALDGYENNAFCFHK